MPVPVPPPQRFRHSPAWLLGRIVRRIRLFAKPRVDVGTAEPDWIFERDVPVTVRDGTVLRVNVFRPRGDEPVPVIMSAHPYGKDAVPARSRSRRALNPQYRIMPQPARVGISAWTGWEAPDPAFWVPRGYAVVNADARGGGTSEGQARLFEAQEADDYEDLIAWAGTQAWSTGKVGLDGVSYLALSQYAVAARAPEHLAAICPWEGFSDLYRDFAWPGGIRENGFSVLWSTLTSRAARVAPPPLRRDLARHTTRDQWYRDRTPDLDRIGVPMLVCGSFSDHNLHTRGSFEAFRRGGQALPQRPRRWLYTHRGGKWATYYSADAASIRARFFDHALRGLENGWDALPPVRLAVYESGPTPVAVTAESAWPPADLQMRRLCLDGSNRQPKFIITSINDCVAQGRDCTGLILESALWCRYCYGTSETGAEIAPNDPNWDHLVAQSKLAKERPAAWLEMSEIYGDLAENAEVVAKFTALLNDVWARGSHSVIADYLAG